MIQASDTCERTIKGSDWPMGRWTRKCGKPAKYEKNGQKLCRHHAGVGTWIVRDGDVGEIKARYDSEKELRENIHLFPGMTMQRLIKNHRRTLTYNPSK